MSQSNEEWWTHADTGGARACKTTKEKTVMHNTDANIMREVRACQTSAQHWTQGGSSS